MSLKPKNKGHANFYECCDLTKKVYLAKLYQEISQLVQTYKCMGKSSTFYPNLMLFLCLIFSPAAAPFCLNMVGDR